MNVQKYISAVLFGLNFGLPAQQYSALIDGPLGEPSGSQNKASNYIRDPLIACQSLRKRTKNRV